MMDLSNLMPSILTIGCILAISVVAFLISLTGSTSSQIKNGLNLFGCLFLPEAEVVTLALVL